MLLKFGARNCYSFKEGIEISLELGKNCPKSISKGSEVSNLLCIKGANGSGKTNVMKILSFLAVFCRDSFETKPESNIQISSFFFNDDPSDIFCEMSIDGYQYRYEVSLTKTEIIEETLWRKKKNTKKIYQRTRNKVTTCINEFSELKSIKLRTNASFISTAHQYDVESIIPIYNFFRTFMANVSWAGKHDLPFDFEEVSQYYHDTPQWLKFVTDTIKKCDQGIDSITLQSKEDEKGNISYFPVFEHKAKVPNNRLLFMAQSSGTKALYTHLLYYQVTIQLGGILVMDEFDINFHPHILPFIVGMFDDEELNPRNAQLIFSTHNTDILEYMTKYRTVLINQKNSESYGYRLDEIPGDLIRNDRPIAPIYNAGKIGGVPKV